jgi:hypothetical protein
VETAGAGSGGTDSRHVALEVDNPGTSYNASVSPTKKAAGNLASRWVDGTHQARILAACLGSAVVLYSISRFAKKNTWLKLPQDEHGGSQGSLSQVFLSGSILVMAFGPIPVRL